MTTNIVKKVSKSGKVSYQYFVDGKMVRTSGRKYVASTADGSFFWGRMDLVGKGEYASAIQYTHYCETVTFDDLKKQAIKELAKAIKDLEDYRNKNGKHAKFLRSLYNQPSGIYAADKFEKEFKEDIAMAEERLEKAQKRSTDEYINSSLKDYRAKAVHRRASLSIVHYDIKDL